MKKFSKAAAVNRCKALLFELVRLRDKRCVKCGRGHGKLDTSHIFPKSHYKSMEFLSINVKLLCFHCHRNWWHLNPAEAGMWIRKYLGPTKWSDLQSRAITSVLMDQAFFEQTEIRLKEEIAELLGNTVL